jgi:hypothetical protein
MPALLKIIIEAMGWNSNRPCQDVSMQEHGGVLHESSTVDKRSRATGPPETADRVEQEENEPLHTLPDASDSFQ